MLTTPGEHYTAEGHYQRGHYKNPMSDQEIEEKFSALTHELLTPAQTDAILDCLWHLEQVKDFGEVIRIVGV